MSRAYFGRATCFLVCLACGTLCVAAAPRKQPSVTFRPGHVIAPVPAEGQQNLVPNASFECGADGWGSTEREVLPGWYGTLNGLFGRLDSTTAADGHTSLKIEITPENTPVAMNDYLHCQRYPIKAPLAANVGWLAVKPGQQYTLSAAMKAAEAGTPARLIVRQFRAAPADKLVQLTTDWQRYSVEFTAAAEACYVLAGPDLAKSDDNPNPPQRATVWLDAVQLTPGETKTSFVTRQPVELGMATDKPGNIFAWDEPLQIRLTVASADKAERKADIDLYLTDFFDEEVWRDSRSVTLAPQSAQDVNVTIPPSSRLRGYLLLRATVESGKTVERRNMRLAATPVYTLDESRFGMNHAFGWPEMLALCKQAGIHWMRDWSMKWQSVQPEPGPFNFTETDAQIDRQVREKMKVLEVLCFPSTMWNTTAPDRVPRNEPWYLTFSDAPDPQTQFDEILAESGSRIGRLGYAPRDMKEFETYVGQCVAHYKDRVHYWQCFNEPLLTSYAIPQRAGYTVADYIKFVEAFVKAARQSDPQCKLLAGFNLGTAKIPVEFISQDGLKDIDIFTLHTYPGRNPPEWIEKILVPVGEAMKEKGTVRPIWFTEFAYYADDETWIEPFNAFISFSGAGAGYHLPNERIQAEYQVRIAVTMFAHGVEKLFFHAGTGSAINHGNLWTMFLRYGNKPFKNYASQAVMAKLLTPDCKFVKKLLPDQPVKAYLFSDGKRTVGVVWATANEKPKPIELTNARLQVWDLVGRPQVPRTLTPSETPVYIVGEGISADEFEKGVVVAP